MKKITFVFANNGGSHILSARYELIAIDLDPDPFSLLTVVVSHDIGLMPFVYLLLLLALLFCSAFVSGSEVAFFSLSSARLEELGQSRKHSERTVARLLSKPQKLLATILVANNLVNIAIVILSEYLIRQFFDFGGREWLRVLVSVFAITFILLLFGEVMPKVLASADPLKFAKRSAPVFEGLCRFFTPVSAPMILLSKLVDKLSASRPRKSNLSMDTLSQALEIAEEDKNNAGDKKILEGIVSFGKTEARQVMTPRIDVFALRTDTPYAQVKKQILKFGYSRIPVYENDLDDIRGILYIKDLLPFLNQKDADWVSLLRKPIFVPENRKIDDIMEDFQQKKVHMAIVVDEYGGTSGVLSMDDIIEEIVGDISDEFDDEDTVYSRIDDCRFLFEGKIPLRDFYKVMDISGEREEAFEEAAGESESLAGFVLEIAGVLPKKGDSIHFDGYSFTVEALDRKRIKQICVSQDTPAV